MICPVCEKQSGFFYTRKNDCALYRCKSCKFIYVRPVPEDNAEIYSEGYFSGSKSALGYADYEGDRDAMAGAFRAYLEKIEKFFPEKGKLLDVGAATGHFVSLAGANGWEAEGIEISEYAAEKGREKGLQITTGNFEVCDFPGNRFDAITFWDVLEHFEKPEAAVHQAWKILKPGGVLAINTPDSESFAAKIFGRRWHAIVPPNHLHIFGRKNLVCLLSRNGFEIVEMSRVGKKFSLRFIFKVLSGWQKIKIWGKISDHLVGSSWGKLNVPLNFRDNMFVIAKKVRGRPVSA
jgi:SAM-dependent methyltransferase